MPKESQILRAITDYLTLKRYLFIRNGTGSFKTEKGGYFKTGSAGSPDILVFTEGGVCIGLEVKTSTGKLNENQVAWKARAEKIGMRYCVVRSLDEAITALQ